MQIYLSFLRPLILSFCFLVPFLCASSSPFFPFSFCPPLLIIFFGPCLLSFFSSVSFFRFLFDFPPFCSLYFTSFPFSFHHSLLFTPLRVLHSPQVPRCRPSSRIRAISAGGALTKGEAVRDQLYRYSPSVLFCSFSFFVVLGPFFITSLCH